MLFLVRIFELKCYFIKAIIIFVFECSSFGVILALYKTLLNRHFSLNGDWCFLMQLHVLVILSLDG